MFNSFYFLQKESIGAGITKVINAHHKKITHLIMRGTKDIIGNLKINLYADDYADVIVDKLSIEDLRVFDIKENSVDATDLKEFAINLGHLSLFGGDKLEITFENTGSETNEIDFVIAEKSVLPDVIYRYKTSSQKQFALKGINAMFIKGALDTDQIDFQQNNYNTTPPISAFKALVRIMTDNANSFGALVPLVYSNELAPNHVIVEYKGAQAVVFIYRELLTSTERVLKSKADSLQDIAATIESSVAGTTRDEIQGLVQAGVLPSEEDLKMESEKIRQNLDNFVKEYPGSSVSIKGTPVKVKEIGKVQL